MVSVKVQGITADPSTNQFLMLLVDEAGEKLLPIVIGQWEAQSIAWNMQGIKMQRPLTHDLFKSFMNSAKVKMNRVVIDNLKDNTFYATIRLNFNGASVEIDSRPSDAVAIALRMSAPIFVSEEVFEKAAVKVDSDLKDDVNEIVRLKKELEDAVECEDYEFAAKLRDQIKELESKNKNSN